MQERAEEAAQLLKTLANAQRLRVLCLLVGREMTVGQINDELADLSQSALSQHLAKLRDEGMVSTRRESQTIWYRFVEGPAQVVIATLYRIYCADVDGPSKPALASRKPSGKR
ncbi:MAG: metalloregulator ArsR/SmtB family transcription factor [Dokdonella sp.]